jgi:hypothetical protein
MSSDDRVGETTRHEDDIQEVKLAIVEAGAEILKWLFGAIGAQTFILLAALPYPAGIDRS